MPALYKQTPRRAEGWLSPFVSARSKVLVQAARLSVPTNEHFLPLLYILALQDQDEGVEFFAEQVTLGSISMRSLKIG